MPVIKLTPNLFRELDILTRTETGCPLSVFNHSESPWEFGSFSFQPEGLFKEVEIQESPGCCCEREIIKIANQIDLEAFYSAQRPEMDWRFIPEDLIYQFIVFHEIGHCLFDLPDILWMFNVRDDAKRCLFFTANEVRTDRFGWKKLSPGRPLPKKRGNGGLLGEVKSFTKRHPDWFPKEPKRIIPISTDPGKMIPVSHVKKRIPWAA